ncbi:MAG TPA: hypothetical protein VNT79_16925 [Phycisphaerae bacterium]|nr:hypothetical protein [Phycisphaerae bacterium]
MGKKAKQTTQYTIRSIPPGVDRALRRKAKAEGKSLNQMVLEALRREAGFDQATQIYTDLDHLIGTWVEDSEFDATLAAQRTIDPDRWK